MAESVVVDVYQSSERHVVVGPNFEWVRCHQTRYSPLRSRATASPLNSISLIEAMITCGLRDREPRDAEAQSPWKIGNRARSSYVSIQLLPTSQCPTSYGPIQDNGHKIFNPHRLCYSQYCQWRRLRVQIPCREFKSYQCAILGLIRLDWSVHYIIHPCHLPHPVSYVSLESPLFGHFGVGGAVFFLQ
jgi:hypothetical protein